MTRPLPSKIVPALKGNETRKSFWEFRPPFYFPENSHFDNNKKNNADAMKINCFLLNFSFLFEKEYFLVLKK